MTYDVAALRRTEFPWSDSGETIYLNHASTGPLPQRTVGVGAQWGQLRANPARVPQDLQFNTLSRGRELIAGLIGASTSEIALATNTSYGINLAAFSLPLKQGDVVLTPDAEFPANVYPWMQLAARRGLEYRRIACDDGVLDAGRLEQELNSDSRVRAVSVSWVQAASGARVDLDALSAVCHKYDAYFVVDAIQGIGPLTLDLSKTRIDILSCGAQKWLMSPWGSGFVYVRGELIQKLEPHDVSWMAVQGSDDFSRLLDYNFTWRDDARRFEFVTLPYQDFAGMNASLELLNALGPANVSAHTLRLAQRIVDWAESRSDVGLVTPASSSRRAGIVCVRPADARAASQRLHEPRIAHSLREGAIRLSPYFYTTEAEVDQALAVIAG
jgi:selenocysteine lyase/cysteine desulfurase